MLHCNQTAGSGVKGPGRQRACVNQGVHMRTLIKIVRDRDQSVLEQDIVDQADGTAIGRAIGELLARIRSAYPKTDLSNVTIKVSTSADSFA